MKVITRANELLPAMKFAQSVSKNNKDFDIFKYAKVTTDSDKILLTATDFECWFTTSVPAEEVEEDGIALIPISPMTKLLGQLKSDSDLLIDCDERGNVQVKCSGFSATFETPAPEEFITPEEEEQSELVWIDNAQEFADALSRVVHACPKRDEYIGADGVLLKREEDKITLAATNGARLALCYFESEEFASVLEHPAVIPQDSARHIVNLLSRAEVFGVVPGKNYITFATPESSLLIRLIERPFPKFNELLSKEFKPVIKANYKELLNALKRISPACERWVRIEIKDSVAVLSARTSDGVAEGKVKVNIEDSAEDFNDQIVLNPKFLKEALSAAESGEISVHERFVCIQSKNYQEYIAPVMAE